MKKLLILLLLILVFLQMFYYIVPLFSSSPINEIVYDMPKEGTWYCSELNVHLVYDRQYGMPKNSYAVIDDTEIICQLDGDYNTPYIYLKVRQSVGDYSVGDLLYWWSVVEMSDDQMILEDHDSGEQFIFKRISVILD